VKANYFPAEKVIYVTWIIFNRTSKL
jgi:hypothetical protein